MPRRNRNPGAGKKPHNGPASGSGWGGPAKGAGKKASLIDIAGPLGPDSNPSGLPGYHAMAKAERIAELKAMLWRIAQQSPRDGDRMVAINSLLDREAGRPVQQIINTELPVGRLSIEQLDSAIGVLERAVGGSLGDPAGGADETAIGKPAGIL